jgi:hypothetical protein
MGGPFSLSNGLLSLQGRARQLLDCSITMPGKDGKKIVALSKSLVNQGRQVFGTDLT